MKIKDWYLKEYPTDELGQELHPDSTFKTLLNKLSKDFDIYRFLGVGDSVVRERVFQKLASIKRVDYNTIYNIWLGLNK